MNNGAGTIAQKGCFDRVVDVVVFDMFAPAIFCAPVLSFYYYYFYYYISIDISIYSLNVNVWHHQNHRIPLL